MPTQAEIRAKTDEALAEYRTSVAEPKPKPLHIEAGPGAGIEVKKEGNIYVVEAVRK